MSQNDDLISREALKEALTSKDLITWTHEYGDAIPVDWLMSVIDNAPTVAINEERPQGEWIFEEDILTFPGNYMKCSNCGMGAVFLQDGQFLSNYCHWCGAKMKDRYVTRGKEE